MKEYNISNDLSPVYKADFIRIAKLYEHGGVWFDFDVLFIAEIPRALFDIQTDLFWFTYLNAVPTGFLAAKPQISVLKELLTSANDRMNQQLRGYQSIGPDLWWEVFTKHNEMLKNTTCLPHQLVYPYNCYETQMMIRRPLQLATSSLYKKTKIETDTFAIHWYNGDPNVKKFIDSLDFNNLSPNRSVLEKYIYLASA